MINLFKQKNTYIIIGILALSVLVTIFVPFIERSGTDSEVFAQWLEYYPHYPNRIKYIVGELNQTTQDLEFFNRKLSSQVSQCSCANAVSACIRGSNVGVFGDTCNNREEIEKTKLKIRDKVEQVYFIEELLRAEMESGLAEELERIDEDEAIILEEGLNEILASTENLTNSALENTKMIENESYSTGNQCNARCNTKAIPSFNACISGGGGQKPMSMKFKIGAGLSDLDLGRVEINEIDLNLPERIQMSDIGSMDDFSIGLQDITIAFPDIPTTRTADLRLDPIIFHLPHPDVPAIPPAGFSCNQINVKAYQCNKEQDMQDISYPELDWFLQTFSWLSNKCQKLPGLTDGNGNPIQEKYEKCFNEEIVHSTIINQCDSLWQPYLACQNKLNNKKFLSQVCNGLVPAGICSPIGHPNSILYSKSQAIARECQGLFESEGELPPADCNLEDLENKCKELVEDEREDAPSQCKFLPLFNETFGNPGPQTYQNPLDSCSSQTISNHSQNTIRLDCPSSPSFKDSLIPKIKLPDLIIPDVELPSFELMPFIKIGLPSLIFEDLILDDLELCSLDKCKRTISSLKVNFQYPSLRIPNISIPPIYADMPKIPNGPQIKPLPIEIGDVKFPPIPIPMPEIDLANLISLNMEMPEISLPELEFIMEFGGIDIDFGNMLLGLISSIFPIPNGCVSAGIGGLPLGFDLPDYHFYWPRFPDMPDLCNNKYININNFCSSINSSLGQDVAGKIGQIEDILNNTIQSQIQARLDSTAVLLESLIRESVHDQLSNIRKKVENAVADSVSQTKENNGMFEIPSAYALLDNINVAMDKVNAELSKIANEITIPWPNSLRRIPLSNPRGYDLPSIPLNNLSYTKEKKINIPGFQVPSFDFDFSISYSGYEGASPAGGNPYPTTEINVNINEIANINQSISAASNKIYDVLY